MRKALLAFCYFLAAVVALAFLALPILAIFVHVPPGRLIDQLTNPVVTDALVVSFKTTLIAQALVLVFGTPTAYLLASRRFPGRSLCVTLVEAGITIPFTQTAVTLAVAFVSSPLYIRQAIAAFEAIDPNLVAASRTLGAGPART